MSGERIPSLVLDLLGDFTPEGCEAMSCENCGQTGDLKPGLTLRELVENALAHVDECPVTAETEAGDAR